MTEYARARKLLSENRKILDNMARVLVERETIYTDEVDMLMQGKDWQEVLAYMEKHDSGSPDRPFGTKYRSYYEEDKAKQNPPEEEKSGGEEASAHNDAKAKAEAVTNEEANADKADEEKDD